jgi:copper chaperone CopZ
MKTGIITASALAFALLGAGSASAELRHVEIMTLGMDWEICAHAVRVAMQKVDGVETARVRLNDGLTILDLKPGNTVTLAKIRQIIKNAGFMSKEAAVTARGTLNVQQVFVVSGTNEQLVPSSSPQQVADEWRFTVSAPKP